uniref:Uncharacterized protein n=1 Tax=Panagrolaimus sp. ES5 TaxID=591445 RepID=A0AC34GC14_9BILA
MGFSIFIFLWLFFAARINGDDFLKERLMSDFDPDVAPYLRKVSGKDVAILTTFNDFQIDIKPSAMDSLSFLYVNEKLDTPIHGMLMDLRCDKQCVIIFEINNGKKIYCQIGKDIAACHCPVNKLTRFSFTTNNYVPNGYLVSEANLTYLLEKVVHPCAPYEYVVKEKEKQKVIRASVKCYDVSHTYVDFEKEYPWQDSQPPDKCILGIFSTIDSQPFISVEPKKSLLKENETNILLYSIADLQKVPNSMITFKKPGWPRLPFQRKKTNQRFTLIKPENIQNFPGFIFDYDDFHCNNAK